MRAEREALKADASAAVASVDARAFSFERLEVAAFVHLRSAGRGEELEELVAFGGQAIGTQLQTVGSYAELAPPQGADRTGAFRTRPSEIVAWETQSATQMPAATPSQTVARCKAAASDSRLLHVVDESHGQAAFLLGGATARQVLQRLAEESSLPGTPGAAVRLRLADLHVTLTWCSDGAYLAFVDVLYADFLMDRVAYAAAFIAPHQ